MNLHRSRRSLEIIARLTLIALATVSLAAGCGAMDSTMMSGTPGGGGNMGGGGNLGATTGGAQDFRQVRQAIENGQVPQAQAFLVEGLLSEHDLPLEGEACHDLLCLQLGAGLAKTRFAADAQAPEAGAARTVLVQVGMSSGLKVETFRRAPLNLALVVDVSGSMRGTKMEATRTALARLADRLDEGDVVSIVAFSSKAWLALGPTAGDDTGKQKIRAAIMGLHAEGSTNMEAGLALGYQQLALDLGTQGSDARASRLMIFTDAQPNTGRTDAGSFVGQIQKAATDGIGLTAFGVGLDFRAELIDIIANLRGGNYFYLADAEAIRTIFDKDFDYLVTPLAYDLKLELIIPAGFRFVAAHGVKAWKAGCTTSTIEVPTVFLSRNKGAMLVELERDGSALPPTAEIPVLSGRLSYVMPDGDKISGRMAISLPATAFSSQDEAYSQPAVRRVVALVTEVEGMQEACRRYWDNHDRDGARALLTQLRGLLEAHQAALGDTSLSDEIALVNLLHGNMK